LITIDFLDLDSRKAWVEVPVNPADRASGSARFCLQDIPYAKWQSLIMEIVSSGEAMTTALDALRQSGTEQATAAFGSALARVLRAQTEVVRWGVSGHDDIASSSGPVAYESEPMTFDGTTYHVASAKMLRLYTLIGRDKQGGSTLLGQLSAAIRRHQAGEEQPTLEALWTSASSNG
jgi:hypothetical protein